MDLTKYFAVTHERHTFCNPVSGPKIDELIDALELAPDASAVDIACGKAEFLIRVVRRWGCRGIGVDLNPFFVAAARERLAQAALEPAPEIVEGDGSQFAVQPESVDLAGCLGASWIFGGHRETLTRLAAWTRPGGCILVGEPFWLREPSAEHLAAAGMAPDSWGTHTGNVEEGVELGLALLYTAVSTPDDWDRYQGQQWTAAERYARDNSEDPEAREILALMRKLQGHYLRWGRDEIGWALYLFAKPRD